MIMRFATPLLLMILLANCAPPEKHRLTDTDQVIPGGVAPTKKAGGPEFVILTDDFSFSMAKSIYPSAEAAHLDQAQAAALIPSLPALLEAGDNSEEDFREVLSILKESRYVFQLVPFRVDGRLRVLVNAAEKSSALSFALHRDWHTSYLAVLDGGAHFWFCVFDFEQKKILEFLINGHA
jgi:hypothetical protein